MNDVQSLIDRQLGIYCRLNYDNVLKRLVVDGDESFYGLQSSNIVANFDQDPPIFACRFSEAPGYEHILALANEDGRVAIQDTTSVKTASSLESFQCHNNAVFDLAWMPGHMNFVTVSGDHTACLWDVGSGAPRRVLVFTSHSRSVKCAAFRPAPAAPALFASGARDGHVLVWDVRASPARPALCLRPDAWLAHCHAARPPGKRPRAAPRALSVTALAFRDDVTLLSAGECDGNIKAWDLRKSYCVSRREPLPSRAIPYCGSSAKHGYTNLLVDASRTRLYASCMDDVVYCFDVNSYAALPECRYVGHENGTFYIKTCLSPDGMYLVSGSSDKNAYIWNVKCSEPIVKLVGHRAEVTCAAWCPRGDVKLVTCSDDARHKVWRVGREGDAGDAGGAGAEGRAERSQRREPRAAWGALDRTPSSSKRAACLSEGATLSERRARLEPAASRKSKRCLAPALGASDASAPKRLRLEAPLAPGMKRRHEDSDVKLPPSSPERAAQASEVPVWSYATTSHGSFLTPTKRHSPRKCRRISLSVSPEPRAAPPAAPTADLPDFVQTGEAPHLRLMSPIKRKTETTDWLTRMSLQKRGKHETGEKPAPTPLSPKENVPPRRNSTTEKTPKSNKKSRTLLKYFTVASKEK